MSKIQMSFDAAGNVTETQLIRPSGTTPEHALLDEAAMKAAAACRLSLAEGAMPTKIRIDFNWKLGDSTLPNDWPPANPGPLSNTSRAEVLRQLYGLVPQVEVDRCVAARPELAASIQASFAAFADRAQKVLGSLIQEHSQAFAEPVPVALLDWLARQKTHRITSTSQIIDKAICPDIVQRFENQTLTELRTNMLFDLSVLEGRRGYIR